MNEKKRVVGYVRVSSRDSATSGEILATPPQTTSHK